jgi:hypothetical protein
MHRPTNLDPAKGKPLMDRVNVILKAHPYKQEIKHPAKSKITSETTTVTLVTKKPWWKIW